MTGRLDGNPVRRLRFMAVLPLVALLSALLLAFQPPAILHAESIPYRSYIYNAFGDPVASPDGYRPTGAWTGADLGAGPLKEPSDLFVAEDGRIFLADTGNGRILVLDRNLSLVHEIRELVHPDGTADTMASPTGVWKVPSGPLFVADRDNRRILRMTEEGEILQVIGSPPAEEVGENFLFQPTKVAVDGTGILYVMIAGLYRGALQFDRDGSFLGFFGSNTVGGGILTLLQRFNLLFMTRIQRDKQWRSIPQEFSNFDLDARNFLYTCSPSLTVPIGQIRKMNFAGSNIYRGDTTAAPVAWNRGQYGDLQSAWVRGTEIATTFVDLDVDANGFVNALDATRGRIFQYDGETTPTFIFGGIGDQAGTFGRPSAIETSGDTILVLDAARNSLTRFEPTPLGRQVREAILAFRDGRYIESIEPWLQVLKTHTNYEPAHVGLGKAYFQMGRYEDAMAHFELGNDPVGRSQAFQGYRARFVTDHFPLLAALFAAGAAGLWALARAFARWKRKRPAGTGTERLSGLGSLRLLLHPLAEAESLRSRTRLPRLAPWMGIGFFFLSAIVEYQLTSRNFTYTRAESLNLLLLAARTLLVVVLFVTANWSVSTLLEGKGTIGRIAACTGIALVPASLASLAATGLTHLVTMDEAAILSLVRQAGSGWSVLVLVLALLSLHEFTLPRTLASLALTGFALLVQVFLIFLFFSLVQEMLSFFQIISFEISLRFL